MAEIELKRLELEDELSEISENAEESGLTRISPQLTIVRVTGLNLSNKINLTLL